MQDRVVDVELFVRPEVDYIVKLPLIDFGQGTMQLLEELLKFWNIAVPGLYTPEPRVWCSRVSWINSGCRVDAVWVKTALMEMGRSQTSC